jgi:hypothetical protein
LYVLSTLPVAASSVITGAVKPGVQYTASPMAASRRCNWTGVSLVRMFTGCQLGNGRCQSTMPLKASRATIANLPGRAGCSAEPMSSTVNSRPFDDTRLLMDGMDICDRIHSGSAIH